jgi:AcrR family transcriptional regulator
MGQGEVHVDTREALLDAAEELFSQRGYAAVGIREIVEHAGVNIAAIKYHFGSKSDLYLETVRRAMERRETAASWEVLQEDPPTPVEAATMLVRFVHRFLERHMAADKPNSVCSFILHEAAEPTEAIDSVVQDFIEPHERKLIGVIRVLVPDAERRALSLFAQSIMGQILHFRVFKPVLERMAVGDLSNPERIQRVADHIARFSLQGLGCPPDVVDQAVETATSADKSASPTGRPSS